MKICINGITRDMTPEEEAEQARLIAEMPEQEPTTEDRISDLEDLVSVLTEVICND